jgi:hypothetical protein
MKHSLVWMLGGHLPWMKCSKCGKRKWAEEIIGNFGWCDKCFDKSLDEYFSGVSDDITQHMEPDEEGEEGDSV